MHTQSLVAGTVLLALVVVGDTKPKALTARADEEHSALILNAPLHPASSTSGAASKTKLPVQFMTVDSRSAKLRTKLSEVAGFVKSAKHFTATLRNTAAAASNAQQSSGTAPPSDSFGCVGIDCEKHKESAQIQSNTASIIEPQDEGWWYDTVSNEEELRAKTIKARKDQLREAARMASSVLKKSELERIAQMLNLSTSQIDGSELAFKLMEQIFTVSNGSDSSALLPPDYFLGTMSHGSYNNTEERVVSMISEATAQLENSKHFPQQQTIFDLINNRRASISWRKVCA
jgi:hypothetical protein